MISSKKMAPVDMIRQHARNSLLIILSVAALGGCKERIFTTIDLPDDDLRTGAGLGVEAVYLSDAGEVEDLFGSFLPANGILPVLVAVRNNDTVPLRLHSRDRLAVGDDFASFVLEAGGRQVEPLHPLEVVISIKAKEDEVSYKDIDREDVTVGIIFPPLGAWYAWKEYKARTEYKPMIRASLLPARFSGSFDPLDLAPGEEKTGYLYFPVDSTISLYDESEIKIIENEKVKTRKEWSLKEGPEAGLVLQVYPSLTGTSEAVFTVGDYDSGQVRDVCFAGSPPWTGKESLPGIFRIIDEGGKERLLWTPMTDEPDGSSIFETFEIDSYSGSGAAIADARAHGGRGLVAVNFTRKTRVYLLDLSGQETKIRSIRIFERKTDSVYLTPDGAFVVTSDGICREIPVDGKRDGAYIKLGTSVNETVLDGDGNLHAFCGKMTSVFDLSADRRYELVSEETPLGSGVEVVAAFADDIVLRFPGSGGSGDSLMVYDPSVAQPVSGLALRGNVVCSGPCPGGVILQMENGTVLVLKFGKGKDGETSLDLDRAFFLEDICKMISGTGGSLMMSGTDGGTVYGRFDPWLPLLYGVESRAVLTPSLPIARDGSP